MNLKQILKISFLEFKRSNNKLNRRVIYILIPTIIIVLFLLFIFLSSEEMFESKFYTIEFTKNSDTIPLDSKFLLKDNADIVVDISNKVLIFNSDNFKSKAASELFIKNIKLYNDFLISDLPNDLKEPVLIKTEFIRRNETLEKVTINNINEQNNEQGQIIQEDLNNEQDQIIQEDLNNEQVQNIQQLNENIIEKNDLLQQNIDKSLQEIIKLNEIKPNQEKDIKDDNVFTPSELSPSLPFEPIYLALTIIVVLTFLSLIYSNRIYDEKVNSKGILLLVSPLSKWDIIIGKTLPFVIITLIFGLIIGFLKTNSFLQTMLLLLILLPIILVYFSISLFTALISRSFKELSFLGIFNISMFSLFLLIPAFMISFSEASLVSPLSIIVKIIMNEIISFDIILFSILPSLFFSLIIFIVSSLLFTSENLFSYKNIKEKILKIYEENVFSFKRLFFVSAASIPFIFFIQLIFIVIMISLNMNNNIYFLLLLSAFIEEYFKSLGIYSLFKSNKISKNNKNYFLSGLITGLGFFTAEKIMLLLMITPFLKQYQLIIFSGLVIPLILHSILSIIFAFGINKIKKSFWLMLILVTILHFLMNIALIKLFG
jgi:ABC-type Na+ efflux pump permease subunit